MTQEARPFFLCNQSHRKHDRVFHVFNYTGTRSCFLCNWLHRKRVRLSCMLIYRLPPLPPTSPGWMTRWSVFCICCLFCVHSNFLAAFLQKLFGRLCRPVYFSRHSAYVSDAAKMLGMSRLLRDISWTSIHAGLHYLRRPCRRVCGWFRMIFTYFCV